MVCHRDQTADHLRKDMPVPLLSAPQVAGQSPAGPERSLDAAFSQQVIFLPTAYPFVYT